MFFLKLSFFHQSIYMIDVITLICNAVSFFDSHNRCPILVNLLHFWVTKSLETSALSITIGVKCIDRTNSTLFVFFLIIILMFCYPRYLKSYLLSSLEKCNSQSLFFSKATLFNNLSLICLLIPFDKSLLAAYFLFPVLEPFSWSGSFHEKNPSLFPFSFPSIITRKNRVFL
jgi:hypothetical protein